MFCGIEFIRTDIYDLLIITKGDWYDHLDKLGMVLKTFRANGLKCNIKSHTLEKLRWNIWVYW